MSQAYASGRVTLDAAQLADELVQQAAYTVFENAVAGRERANDWWLDHGLSSEQGGLVFFLATEAADCGFTRDDLTALMNDLSLGNWVLTSYPYEDDLPEYGLTSPDGSEYCTLAEWIDGVRSAANTETKGN